MGCPSGSVVKNPLATQETWVQSQVGKIPLEKQMVTHSSILVATATAKSLQSCPTLCNPIDSCPPGSPVPGILQARTLEWVAISFSNAWKWKVKVKSLSRVRLFMTPWTAAYQAPPSMGFSRQEYWSGVPLPVFFFFFFFSLPVFLMSGKSHGQKTLAGYSPRGCKRVRQNWVTKINNQRKQRLCYKTKLKPIYFTKYQRRVTQTWRWKVQFVWPDLIFILPFSLTY